MYNNESVTAYRPPAAPPDNAVTVITAVDDRYLPHLAALVESIKAYFSQDRFLEFFVLDGGIQEAQKKLLERQFSINFTKGNISFINCEDFYKNIPTHTHLTTATFYRFLVGGLFPNHKKILYLDTDIIVLSDISELFDSFLQDEYVVGAAYDLGMKAFFHQGKKKKIPRKIKDLGGIPVHSYLTDYLGLGEHANKYFQAGVMLFSLDQFRELNIEKRATDDLLANKYWLLDQDVLNKFVKGKVFELDTAWNCLSFSSELFKNLPHEWAEKAQKDFLAPKIVHYAGSDEKPWNDAEAPLAHFYWFFLRRTFWYEQVMQSTLKKKNIFKRLFRK